MSAAEPAELLSVGDNLALLRDAKALPDGSVSLVYMDPPFASGKDYGLLPGDGTRSTGAPGRLFTDSWRWDEKADAAHADLAHSGETAALGVLSALRGLYGDGPLTAYVAMMAPRLAALRRVLAPSASLYLHCDPTASFALRLLLDAVFGPGCVRREIVWRTGWVSGFKARAANWARNHDVILYAATGPTPVFHKAYAPHPKGYARRGAAGASPGVALDDVWTDIYTPWIQSFSREKVGFATQKPLALLSRIISASSDPLDLVLDPFCGSGTTLLAARRLGRRAAGMDLSPLAAAVTRARLLAEVGADRPCAEPWPVAMARPSGGAWRDLTAWACLRTGAMPLAPAPGGEVCLGEWRRADGAPAARLYVADPAGPPIPDGSALAAAAAAAHGGRGPTYPVAWYVAVSGPLAPHRTGEGVAGEPAPDGAPVTWLDPADLDALAARAPAAT